MKQFTIKSASAHLTRLIKLASTGEEVVIVRGSTAVARLVAVALDNEPRRPGSLRGRLRIGREFFEDLPASELRRWDR